ncbi:MAG: hypothetical protein RIC89_00240 [Pseudomonadales bacterium]
MRERERHIVGALVLLMLLLWLGFLVHRDPSFAGSFTGTMVGIAAALFMLGPFLYLVVKRVGFLKAWVTRRVSMRTLLAWHIYAGVLGPILAVIHSAHRFDSTLGNVLLPLILLTVVSGFVGRYLLSQISTEIRDKQQLLVGLRTEYEQLRETLASDAEADLTRVGQNMGVLASLTAAAPWRGFANEAGPRVRLLHVIDALSDVEYAIRAHDAFRVWFKRWLKFHIALSLSVLGLLVAHIAAELYVGLRWL